MPFYWGIAADRTVAFSDDAKLIKQACGKSFAPFPQGMYFSPITLLATKVMVSKHSGLCRSPVALIEVLVLNEQVVSSQVQEGCIALLIQQAY